MSPHARKLLFWTLICAFFLGGGAVIFYAQGWRLDLATLRLRKVGAIYIHTSPKNAEVLLDGKSIHRSLGLFSDSTLINNLFPKRYNLEAKADGYLDWRATVTVEPSLVSEIKNAILVPAKPQPIIPGEEINDFKIINGQIAAYKNSSGWRIEKVQLSGETISGWDKNSNVLTFDRKNGTYFLNFRDSGRVLNINQVLSRLGVAKPTKIILNGNGSQTLFIFTANSVRLVNPQNYSVRQIAAAKSGESFGETAGDDFTLAWASFNPKNAQSQIWLYDYASGKTQIGKTMSSGKIIKLSWISPRVLGLIQESGEFFIYDGNRDDFIKKAGDAKNATISEKGRLAVLENRSLEIFSDRDGKYWRFNLPRIESVKKLEWYDDFHLFVHYPEEVKFLSLEDGSLENFIPVVQTKAGYFEPASSKFYYLADNGIYYLQFARD